MCRISCSWQNNLLLNFQKHMTSLLHDNYIINYLDYSIEFYYILLLVLSVEVFFPFLDNKTNFKPPLFSQTMCLCQN